MELWKDIPGYEGAYQVSSLGRVKSLERKVCCRNNGIRTVSERILRPGKYCKAGHLSVALGRSKPCAPVHQLVLAAFVRDMKPAEEVRHINGNPTDNRLENLFYGSRTENILDVFRQGKRWRKLNLSDVSEIRTALQRGETGRNLARLYGVSENCISAIKTGRTFSWAP
ncbi:MAG: NUMOD4 motif-containing HNH endonuclease [Clostridiales bacterium]|nr:NUMOD4 motif-containing HNH endonuclease [Clostridiales bacterium]